MQLKQRTVTFDATGHPHPTPDEQVFLDFATRWAALSETETPKSRIPVPANESLIKKLVTKAGPPDEARDEKGKWTAGGVAETESLRAITGADTPLTGTAQSWAQIHAAEAALATGAITVGDRLGSDDGGGVNASYHGSVVAPDGTRYGTLIKPARQAWSVNEGVMHENTLATRAPEAGRAAYLVNEAMGRLVDMPPSVVRDVPGLGRSEVSWWMPNDGPSYDYPDGDVQFSGVRDDQPAMKTELSNGATLDYAIGNMDRHMGNVLIRDNPAPGEPRALMIDHGFSFPDAALGSEWEDHANTALMNALADEPLTNEAKTGLTRLATTWDRSAPLLGRYLTPSRLNGLRERVGTLREYGMVPQNFYDLYGSSHE